MYRAAGFTDLVIGARLYGDQAPRPCVEECLRRSQRAADYRWLIHPHNP